MDMRGVEQIQIQNTKYKIQNAKYKIQNTNTIFVKIVALMAKFS
jgi:hypothetical protein